MQDAEHPRDVERVVRGDVAVDQRAVRVVGCHVRRRGDMMVGASGSARIAPQRECDIGLASQKCRCAILMIGNRLL